MLCPACKSESLTMAERSGIEIDYCPKCRGVWLDRGELDKIIERASPPANTGSRERDRDHDRNGDRGPRPVSNAPPQKRRESLLGELFDF
jgi:uncharacterized protein